MLRSLRSLNFRPITTAFLTTIPTRLATLNYNVSVVVFPPLLTTIPHDFHRQSIIISTIVENVITNGFVFISPFIILFWILFHRK